MLEIVDPTTAEVIASTDVDGLLAAYDRLTRQRQQLTSAIDWIRVALAAMTEGDTRKTRRVPGHRLCAAITMPADRWSQTKLKEAWHAYPHLREQVLKIATIGIRLREWQKMETESGGPPDREQFRRMIALANEGPSGLPTVRIEELKPGVPAGSFEGIPEEEP